MAGIGLSDPIVAVHSTTPGLYTKKVTVGEYIELTITPNEPSDNELVGDNQVWDTDDGFTGGTVDMTTTRLSPAKMVDVLGVKEQATSSETGAPKHYVFDRKQKIPHLAVTGIAMVRDDDDPKTYYQAYIVEDCKFRNPTFAFVTKPNGNIEWQTPKLSGAIYESKREDTNVDHPWLFVSQLFETKEDAADYIDDMLQIETPTPGGGA